MQPSTNFLVPLIFVRIENMQPFQALFRNCPNLQSLILELESQELLNQLSEQRLTFKIQKINLIGHGLNQDLSSLFKFKHLTQLILNVKGQNDVNLIRRIFKHLKFIKFFMFCYVDVFFCIKVEKCPKIFFLNFGGLKLKCFSDIDGAIQAIVEHQKLKPTE